MSDRNCEAATSQEDRTLPVKAVTAMPMISAESYQHIGRYSGAVVMSVFEQIGGARRMASWADTNPTDFFTKIFPKMISRSQQVDHTGSITIDDAISRMERMDDPVDVDFVEIKTYDL